jgi:hypothetical protein
MPETSQHVKISEFLSGNRTRRFSTPTTEVFHWASSIHLKPSQATSGRFVFMLLSQSCSWTFSKRFLTIILYAFFVSAILAIWVPDSTPKFPVMQPDIPNCVPMYFIPVGCKYFPETFFTNACNQCSSSLHNRKKQLAKLLLQAYIYIVLFFGALENIKKLYRPI